MSRRLTLRRKDAHTLTLGGLDSFLAGILREVPETGEPGPSEESRFFPAPTGGKHPELDRDWETYVRSELKEGFGEARRRVAEDLEKVRDLGRRGMEVDIPEAHRWEWVHALNQARLALATRHGLGEAELEEKVPLEGEAALAAFQVQFYGLLQEWLLAEQPGEGA